MPFAWLVPSVIFSRQEKARRVLGQSGLPEPARERIDEIVRATRLRPNERAEVARELAAHAQDAIDAGRELSDVLSSLGDPRVVARLIRRSVKRKRSPLYHARVWLTRGIAGLAALVLLSYAVLFVRFHAGSPTISTDYLAVLNARHADLAPEQRAYPAYEDLAIAWGIERDRLEDATLTGDDEDLLPGTHRVPGLTPDHPDYEMIVYAVEALRPQIDRAAAAALLPAIGRPYTSNGTFEIVEGTSVRRFRAEPAPALDDHDSWMVGVLLPDLPHIRSAAKLVVFDARIAAREGDADRALDRLTATFTLAAQTGREPFLISSLVAIAINELACVQTRAVLHEHPDLFDESQLAQLAHTVASTRRESLNLSYDSERYFFDDFLQRGYTDDGRGDGRLTPEGVELLGTALGHPEDFGVVPDGTGLPVSTLLSPAVLALDAGRRYQHDLYHGLMDLARSVEREGPHRLPELDRRFDAMVNSTPGLSNTPVKTLVPALSRAVSSWFLAGASADATSTMIAIHAYRARTGELPETLDELVPDLLPAVPADPFEHWGTIKYARTDAEFTLYFVGADGDDDGGRAEADTDRFSYRVRDLLSRYRYADALGVTGRIASLGTDAEIPDADWVVVPPVVDK